MTDEANKCKIPTGMKKKNIDLFFVLKFTVITVFIIFKYVKITSC